MKIGIDARFYGPLGKGLGRYTQKLIEHLERIDTENDFVIFLRRENFDTYQPKNPRFRKVLADVAWYSWREQFILPFLLRRERCDLLHFPHFNVPLLYFGRYAVTIHDLILFHFPTIRATMLPPLYYWFKYVVYRALIWIAVRRAAHIIAVSEFTKKDIIEKLGVSEKKISVTYESNSDLSKNRAADPDGWKKVCSQYGILKPYALYVGNAYPHKNLERLLAAYERLGRSAVQLVLVGKTDYFYDRLKRSVPKEVSGGVIFADDVSDTQLEDLYRHATIFVFVSLYEGFGLPPLEAMARGVPVVASRASCLGEILGESAYFVNGNDTADIARGIRDILSNETVRAEYIRRGKEQVKKYSWERMARQTMEIYKREERREKREERGERIKIF